ncbi:LysR family transcriptional regulator [Idiomarina xiamenensis]|uniref:LysR family transcriptional regulator n=1 Tax=Idiomarina xiamenensis 10-D-4 TaxID=740709 RepID=K2JP81_9GAMM|nr:LysR family transcriptional regulator [Idiomarina xiamenensis]EKE85301.1 LysR family transcriptional regulator [Idiomarina xiamenensis 10-D-4]
MTIQQLEIFLAIVESGSLHGAARRLHRTQSALSMAIKKLEQHAGFALFDRHQYRLRLTPKGQSFLRQAEEVLRQQQRLLSLSERLQHGAEVTLRIDYDRTCNFNVLVPVLRRLQQQFPATELVVGSNSQLRTLRRIIDGDSDVGLCPWLPTFHQHADVETLPVAELTLAIVASRDLLNEYGGMPRNRTELLNLPLLLPQDMDIGINFDSILRLPSSRRIRMDDIAAQRDMLVAGLGWGIIPEHLVAAELASGVLQNLSIAGVVHAERIPIHLVRASQRMPGVAAAALWQSFL